MARVCRSAIILSPAIIGFICILVPSVMVSYFYIHASWCLWWTRNP
jgi:hypothetical protein